MSQEHQNTIDPEGTRIEAAEAIKAAFEEFPPKFRVVFKELAALASPQDGVREQLSAIYDFGPISAQPNRPDKPSGF